VQNSCVGRSYNDFPQAMKMFIDSHFKIYNIVLYNKRKYINNENILTKYIV